MISTPSVSPAQLVAQVGGTYSRELGIDLACGESGEIGKWWLAAMLFGARISGTIAMRTYRTLEQAGTLSPQAILDAGWDKLVAILDRGGYVRYDYKTANKFLDVCRALQEQYSGDLNVLHGAASDSHDLERRLQRLGKGIGETTVNIFLRELRGVWQKADPFPSERAISAARALRLIPAGIPDGAHSLRALEAAWRADGMRVRDFPAFEAALVRYEALQRRKTRDGKRRRKRLTAREANGASP